MTSVGSIFSAATSALRSAEQAIDVISESAHVIDAGREPGDARVGAEEQRLAALLARVDTARDQIDARQQRAVVDCAVTMVEAAGDVVPVATECALEIAAVSAAVTVAAVAMPVALIAAGAPVAAAVTVAAVGASVGLAADAAQGTVELAGDALHRAALARPLLAEGLQQAVGCFDELRGAGPRNPLLLPEPWRFMLSTAAPA